MVMEYLFGRMEADTKAIGSMAMPVVSVNIFIQMALFIKVHLREMKLMDMGRRYIIVGIVIWESGKMGRSVGKDNITMLVVKFMMVNITITKNMAWGHSYIQMDPSTKVSGRIIKETDMGLKFMKMGINIKDISKWT